MTSSTSDRSGGAAIEVADLRKSYGEVQAVKGVSFEVDPGEAGCERLAVNPEDVVHPGLLGGWLVSKPPVPRRTPDEVAR